MTPYSLVLATAVALSFSSHGFAEELRWKFKADDAWTGKVDQKSEVVTSIAGKATAMVLETGMEFVWNVTAVDEAGSASVSQRLQRLQMTLDMPSTEPIRYDSTQQKPTGDARLIAEAVAPLLETEVKFTLSTRGEITAVQLDESAQKALESLPASHALKTLLSKEGLSNVLRQTVVVLPEGEIKPGDDWQRSANLKTPLGMVKQTTTYKLLEPDASSPEVSRIESVSQIEVEPAAKPRPATLKQQDHKGLILFDNAAGRLQSAEINQELVTASSLKETALQVKVTSSLKMTLMPR